MSRCFSKIQSILGQYECFKQTHPHLVDSSLFRIGLPSNTSLRNSQLWTDPTTESFPRWNLRIQVFPCFSRCIRTWKTAVRCHSHIMIWIAQNNLNYKLTALHDSRGSLLRVPVSWNLIDLTVVRWQRCRQPRLSIQFQISQAFIDKCEIDRNPISQAAVRAVGDAHLKCCMQMYCALAVEVHEFEESNGAEAWRLIQSTCARHSKSTICFGKEDYNACETLVRPHGRFWIKTEILEAGRRRVGTRLRELLADAVKFIVMMNMAPIFLRNSKAIVYSHQHSSACSLVAVVLILSNLQSREKGQRWKPAPQRKSHDQHEFYWHQCARIVANLDIGRKIARIPGGVSV